MEDIEIQNIKTPSQERKRIENEKLKDEWEGCCSKTNKHYLKYITQIIMGSSVMIFSMIMITLGDGENNSIYFSLLSGTMGIFIPHPTIKDDDNY